MTGLILCHAVLDRLGDDDDEDGFIDNCQREAGHEPPHIGDHGAWVDADCT